MVLKGDYQGTLSAQALLLRDRVVSVLLHGVNVWGQPLPYFAIGAKFEIWWRIVRSCCALFLTARAPSATQFTGGLLSARKFSQLKRRKFTSKPQ